MDRRALPASEEVGWEEELETGSRCEARGLGSLPSALAGVTVGVCVSPGVALVDPGSAVYHRCGDQVWEEKRLFLPAVSLLPIRFMGRIHPIVLLRYEKNKSS